MSTATWGLIVAVTIATVFLLIGVWIGRASRREPAPVPPAVASEQYLRDFLAARESVVDHRPLAAPVSSLPLPGTAPLPATPQTAPTPSSAPVPAWISPCDEAIRPATRPSELEPVATPEPDAPVLAPLSQLVPDSGRHHRTLDPLGVEDTRYLPQVRPRTQETT